MNISCNKSVSRFFCSIFIMLTSFTLVANASTLEFKSDESIDVDIIIELGDGSILPNNKQIKTVLKPKEEKKLEVKREDIEKDTFSVVGKVTIPSLYNKCRPLLVDQDYKIVFTGAKAGGTICMATPLK
jgi:hypothetical protein